MWYLNYINKLLQHHDSRIIFSAEYHPTEKPWRLGDCYSLMYRSLLMIGSNEVAGTLRKQIVFFTILITGMYIYLIWEAMLISYFTLPTRLFPFNSWEEFLTKTDNKVIQLIVRLLPYLRITVKIC